MAKKKTATPAAAEPIDWRSQDILIEGEPLAEDGLAKARKRLEELIAPYVTTKKTGDIIAFRGKCRYLKPAAASVRAAMRALQFLYGIEAAMQEGDIDRAVRMTMGYTTDSDELSDRQTWNTTGIEAITGEITRKRKGGEGTRKWTPDIEARALELADMVAELKPGPRNRRIAERLSKEFHQEIKVSLVRRYLTPLLKMRNT